MNKDWPTQEQDMQTAASIISKHMELNGGEPLGLIDVIVSASSEDVDVKTPDWIVELANIFAAQYGIAKGQEITSKVLTKCLLTGQTIH